MSYFHFNGKGEQELMFPRTTKKIFAGILVASICGVASASTNVVKTLDQEIGSATSSVNSPSIGAGTSAAGAALSALSNQSPKSQGFQFKDPVVSPSGTYRYYHDSSTPGSYGGHDYSGEVSLDADIYDGLLTGVYYQGLTRHGRNITGSTEDMLSNSVSLYTAKRFIELINAGVAYNVSFTEHHLNGTAVADLDRISNGATAFVGVSDKIEKWFLASTVSFTFASDDYEAKNLATLDTGLASWSNEVSYDLLDFFTLGLAFSYNNYVIQDTFPGVTAVDDDFWMVGPRFRFFPTDQLTVSLDLDTQEGFKNFDAYIVRLGCNYAF
jgi:hypothetical protein